MTYFWIVKETTLDETRDGNLFERTSTVAVCATEELADKYIRKMRSIYGTGPWSPSYETDTVALYEGD